MVDSEEEREVAVIDVLNAFIKTIVEDENAGWHLNALYGTMVARLQAEIEHLQFYQEPAHGCGQHDAVNAADTTLLKAQDNKVSIILFSR